MYENPVMFPLPLDIAEFSEPITELAYTRILRLGVVENADACDPSWGLSQYAGGDHEDGERQQSDGDATPSHSACTTVRVASVRRSPFDQSKSFRSIASPIAR
jgi:hypothetical protein